MNRLSFVLIALFSLQAFGQRTIHVPVDVSSVQAAIVQARDGDTVLVAPGTYNENLDFLGKNITVTSGAKSSAEAKQTVLNGTQDGPPTVWFHSGETRAAVLNGFTIQNGHNSAAQCATGTCTAVSAGILVEGASPTVTNSLVQQNYGCNVVIRNGAGSNLEGNEIVGPSRAQSKDGLYEGACYAYGVSITNATQVQLIRNDVHDNGIDPTIVYSQVYGSGIVMGQAAEIDLIQNKIHDNSLTRGGDGFSEFGTLYFTPPKLLVMAGNLIYRKDVVGHGERTVVFEGQLPGANLPNVVLTNNTFAESVEFTNSFQSAILVNNVFSASYPARDYLYEPVGSYFNTDTRGFDLRYNDEYSPGPPPTHRSLPAGPTNIFTNPLFKDQTNFDYHEIPSSPTLYAGDLSAQQLPATDLDGKNRTVCGKVDMGAYQVHPNPPIALAAAPNPVEGGSPVVFTATLTGNCNVPTGVVTFLDNGTAIGTGTLNGAAVATLSTSFLTVGRHSITATYPGDFNFDDSTGNAVELTVTGLPSATALAVQPNPAKAFQPIAFTATVTDPFVPVTGTVTFTAGTTVLGTAPLVNGVAVLSTSQLGAGTYAVTATFNATTRFAASSATVQLQVEGSPTTTTLRSLLNPSLFGQRVVFQAFVAYSGSKNTPQGTVTFRDGSAVLGTSALDSSGASSVSTDTLSVGTHTITATFNGSQDADSSTSAPLQQVVNPVQVSLSLTATPNPARVGETIQLRLVGTANNGIPPEGTANFFEGTTALGSAPMTAGTAAFSISSLPIGRHVLTASYANAAAGTPIAFASVTVDVLTFDFAISSSATKLDIPHSGYAEVMLTLTPLGAYDRAVHLSCANLPENAICSFDRDTTEPLSKRPQTVKLLVNANVLLEYGPRGSSAHLELWKIGQGVLAAGVFCFGWRRRRIAALCALLLCCLFLVQGCSGKLPASTPTGDYVITVAAQDSFGQAHTTLLQVHVR